VTTLGFVLAGYLAGSIPTGYWLVRGAAALSLPVAAVALGEPWPVDVFAGIAALAVLVLHRANIARLRAGTETRFRFRRGAQPVKS
jgi:glycerol-3-phosphate acyltransferase PlsY